MIHLQTSQQLYDFLKSLADQLRAQGESDLVTAIDFAMGQGGTSLSEFYGESRIALRRVAAEAEGLLTAEERKEVSDAVQQLDAWFQNRS